MHFAVGKVTTLHHPKRLQVDSEEIISYFPDVDSVIRCGRVTTCLTCATINLTYRCAVMLFILHFEVVSSMTAKGPKHPARLSSLNGNNGCGSLLDACHYTFLSDSADLTLSSTRMSYLFLFFSFFSD